MEKKRSLKGLFAKSAGKFVFFIVFLFFFIIFYFVYNNQDIDPNIGNSYHGKLLVGADSNVKLNISFYKKENTAYLRLIQGKGADANYINAEMKIDTLLSHSLVKAKVSLHKKGLLDKQVSIDYTTKLVSAMLHIRNGKLILILNRDDFYIKTDKCNIKEMVFILIKDR